MGGLHKQENRCKTFWLTPEEETEFKAFAKALGLTFTGLIKQSIRFYRNAVDSSKLVSSGKDTDNAQGSRQND